MARGKASTVARDTIAILGRGWYEVDGRRVEVADLLRDAIDRTLEYPPDRSPHAGHDGALPTRTEASGETSLEAARRLVAEGLRPCVLNFASARNPGGGFLNGARAQEESLARSSGLYPCLLSRRMYEVHRRSHDPLYTGWVIYSPDVPVLRDDEGHLLPEPYLCSFLTSPACNAGVALERAGRRGAEAVREAVREAMELRVERVLGVAVEQGETALVLGAWGCGVFQNEPDMVAGLFQQALEGPFRGAFARVIFAVLDTSREQRFLGPFARRFGAPEPAPA